MTLKELSNLPYGLYRIHWKSGGSSLAAIGGNEDGRKWIAPINWISPLEPTSKNYNKNVRGIAKATFLAGR